LHRHGGSFSNGGAHASHYLPARFHGAWNWSHRSRAAAAAAVASGCAFRDDVPQLEPLCLYSAADSVCLLFRLMRSRMQGYAVEWSPFDATRLAVSTAQHFGIVGQGKQYVLQMQHGMIVPTACFDTAVSEQQ